MRNGERKNQTQDGEVNPLQYQQPTADRGGQEQHDEHPKGYSRPEDHRWRSGLSQGRNKLSWLKKG